MTHHRAIRLCQIADAVHDALGVTFDELCGPDRFANIVLAREITVLMARQLTEHSFPEIARYMGGRNHSTIITAYRRAAHKGATDGRFAAAHVRCLERLARRANIEVHGRKEGAVA